LPRGQARVQSEQDDGPAQYTENLEHATPIVAELAPTDTDTDTDDSGKLHRMVEARLEQERKKLVVAETVQSVPMRNHEEDDKKCGVTTSRKCWLLLVAGLLVIVTVAVGAGVGASSGADGSSNTDAPPSGTTNVPTVAPTSRTTAVAPTIAAPTTPSIQRLNLLIEVIGLTILENDAGALPLASESPQGKAFKWLANEDEANLNFNTEHPSVLVERYALAVLYFATNGPTWTKGNGFLMHPPCVFGRGTTAAYIVRMRK
jgi:hypothetical protein